MRNPSKIKPLEELSQVLDSLRSQSRATQVVHCHGVFDLLHIGHIRHFEQAKTMGNLLVVTVTPDQYVNKGPHRPAFSEGLRAEAVAALDCVDYVAINKWPEAVQAIKMIKPNVYAKGEEYRDAEKDITGNIVLEESAVKSVGGKIAFTEDIVFSSTNLINQHMPVFPQEVSQYLSDFSRRYSAGEVIQTLENARALRTLVVGETIVDEYQYCEQIGKSAKEPVLAVGYLSTEKFAGGVLAVANHVANFCDNVDVLTFLGTEDSNEEFIRQNLHSNVDPIFLYKENSPTILKRRFVESYLLQKLFEVYVIRNQELSSPERDLLCAKLLELLPQYDVVIVTDYGHGMFPPEVVDRLCSTAPFLAVNTQANAGNRGFNTISKYPRADFVSLTRYELSLEERSQEKSIRDMVLNVSQKLNCGQVLVTLGKDGNLYYRDTEGFFEAPAIASQVTDTMGAGDAVLSLTALCAAQKAPMEVVGLIGNTVGAQAIATLGHRSSVEKEGLYRHLASLLK
ncbi:MAG: PfkB family carbohydrate kinase [Dehalococcoidia bacterium]